MQTGFSPWLSLYNEDLLPPTDSAPWLVAMEFLEELARGAFKPEQLQLGPQQVCVLTLGHAWDNRFLDLSDIRADNLVVQAVQSRMARYQGRALGRPRLSRLNFEPPMAMIDSEAFATSIAFGIAWDDLQDGSIVLRRGEHWVWGPRCGWRVWKLTP
ncbi:MAG TPA: hypothetical protein VJG32_08085 [Anaerolineae bacterium]|nr:hypothetical protein [Anaerolineae bacterium]